MTLSDATQMPDELPCREDVQEIIDDYKHPEGIDWALGHLHKKIEFPTSKDRGMSKIEWLLLNLDKLTQPRAVIIENRHKAMKDWLKFERPYK